MWRWLVPIGLTATATTAFALLSHAYTYGPHAEYALGMFTASWVMAFAMASPTIFYYRLLLWIGERAVSRAPLLGASMSLFAGAILPPLVHNVVVDWVIPSRDFQNPPPSRLRTVAIDQPLGRDLLQDGYVVCGSECLRILYGGSGRRVVIGDPSAGSPVALRWVRQAGEPMNYHTAYVLWLERRPLCPPVVTVRSERDDTPFPGGLFVQASGPPGDGRGVDNLAVALMASGLCLIGKPTTFDNADIRLGRSTAGDEYKPTLLPNRFGVMGASFDFVDHRTGFGTIRLSQRVWNGSYIKWAYPFAFIPGPRSWIAFQRDHRQRIRREQEQPWAWAGIHLPPLPDIGDERIRALLQAGLNASPKAGRDARHLLAWQYLLRLRDRPLDDIDRILLRQLILDPRIPATDLRPLSEVAKRRDAPSVGLFLAQRIRQTEPDDDEIGRLSHIITELPQKSWPALLPEVRRIALDRDRAGSAAALFSLFEFGDASDAKLLLGLFKDEWPPVSNAQRPHPVSEFDQDRAQASRNRINAYLTALCTLVDKSSLIRPTLVEASRSSIPEKYSGDLVVLNLWGTMARMGIPVMQLAVERKLSQPARDEIARIARQPSRACSSDDTAAKHRPGSQPYWLGGRHDGSTAFIIDVMILLTLIAVVATASITLIKYRAKGKAARFPAL